MSAVFGYRRRLDPPLGLDDYCRGHARRSAGASRHPHRQCRPGAGDEAARTVATIVIGNPLIADAALQSGGILVITGKGYGSTNLLALDRSGQVVMDKTVQVLGASGSNLVVVYKGVERETYSCAPDCETRITLGDSQGYFNAALGQSGARTGQAQTAPREVDDTPRDGGTGIFACSAQSWLALA